MAAKISGVLASSVGLILGGELAVLQAPIFDILSFDPSTLLDDGLRPAEVGIGRRDVGQSLVMALMVVMLDCFFFELKPSSSAEYLRQDASLSFCGSLLGANVALRLPE